MPPRVTVLRVSEAGDIIESLHCTNKNISSISEVHVFKDKLYLGSPFNDYIARVPLETIGLSHLATKPKKVSASKTSELKSPVAAKTSPTQAPTTTERVPVAEATVTTTKAPPVITETPPKSTQTQHVPTAPAPAARDTWHVDETPPPNKEQPRPSTVDEKRPVPVKVDEWTVQRIKVDKVEPEPVKVDKKKSQPVKVDDPPKPAGKVKIPEDPKTSNAENGGNKKLPSSRRGEATSATKETAKGNAATMRTPSATERPSVTVKPANPTKSPPSAEENLKNSQIPSATTQPPPSKRVPQNPPPSVPRDVPNAEKPRPIPNIKVPLPAHVKIPPSTIGKEASPQSNKIKEGVKTGDAPKTPSGGDRKPIPNFKNLPEDAMSPPSAAFLDTNDSAKRSTAI